MAMKKKIKKAKARLQYYPYLWLAGKFAMMLWACSILWVLAYHFADPPCTLLMLQRKNDHLAEAKEWKVLQYYPLAIEDMAKDVPLALIAAEDQRFLVHNGFDWEAIQKAYKYNKKGKKVRGASTITQQVAKNVFLWNERSYVRKALEAYFTVLVELLWGKERIMEVYANIAETGDHHFGVEAISRKAFRKGAKDLSRQEAALVAAVLPNPRKFSVQNPTSKVARRSTRIVRNMRAIGGTALVEHFY